MKKFTPAVPDRIARAFAANIVLAGGIFSMPLHLAPACAQSAAAVASAPVPAKAPGAAEINAFLAKDAKQMPPTGAVLFMGSSSIKLWTSLTQDFSEIPVINRGFGGSFIHESTLYVDRIAVPYKPKIIILCAGTNDLAYGNEKPQQVFEDYEAFVAKVHKSLPDTRIVYLAINPTVARWKQEPMNLEVNYLIEKFIVETNSKSEKLSFIDPHSQLLTAANLPRPELLRSDGLHFNADGYKVWASIIKPRILALAEMDGVAFLSPPTPVGAESKASAEQPRLSFERADVQARIGVVYADALGNLLDKNTVHPVKAGDQDPLGRLANPPGTFIRAGGGYNNPWTRDASLNSWFAGSLLEPVAARNTLWAVCQKRDDGTVVVQQDNQWWDQCIWVKGAWNHYAVTGDRTFLESAYPVAVSTLAILRHDHFNSNYGLFMGPAFFADGIAAYPPPEYDASNKSSFVLDHPHTRELMALSTNCVYREAYRCAARMARALGRPEAEAAALDEQSDAVKAAINKNLWSPEKKAYAYFIPGAGADVGKPYFAQEGAGQSFALLFDVADADKAAEVVRQMHSEPKGIVTLWPSLPQFDETHLGRHNVMLWPLVNGLWASAAAKSGSDAAFSSEVSRITDLVLDSHHNFYEIYNPRTGQPDGGWQNGGHWGPVSDQTWSATAYIAAIHNGLFGMSFEPDGLHLAPTLPARWGAVELADLNYRQMTLTVRLRGQGTHVKSATLDGAKLKDYVVPSGLTGRHIVEVELNDAH